MPRPAVRSRCAQAKTLGLKLMGPWAFADDISWENPPDAKKKKHWTTSCLSKWPGQRLVLCHFLGMRYSTGGGCLGYPFSVDAEGYREVIKGHSLKGVPKPGELTPQEVERIKLEDGSEAARDQLAGGLVSGLIIPSASKC